MPIGCTAWWQCCAAEWAGYACATSAGLSSVAACTIVNSTAALTATPTPLFYSIVIVCLSNPSPYLSTLACFQLTPAFFLSACPNPAACAHIPALSPAAILPYSPIRYSHPPSPSPSLSSSPPAFVFIFSTYSLLPPISPYPECSPVFPLTTLFSYPPSCFPSSARCWQSVCLFITPIFTILKCTIAGLCCYSAFSINLTALGIVSRSAAKDWRLSMRFVKDIEIAMAKPLVFC